MSSKGDLSVVFRHHSADGLKDVWSVTCGWTGRSRVDGLNNQMKKLLSLVKVLRVLFVTDLQQSCT